MPEITIEVSEDEINQIANSRYGLTNVIGERIKIEAEKLIAIKLQGTVISNLVEALANYKPSDKTEAESVVSVLTKAHTAIENTLAEIGLEHEIYVYLNDGRTLDVHDHYSKMWYTSSDQC